MPSCDNATPPSPAMPEPRPNASISTRPVGTPQQAAMARFCVTARTFIPRRVLFSSNQVSTSTSTTNRITAIRFHGSTRLGSN
ncbi:hypothetical protein D3C73_1387910 [compost metagenome]